MAIGGQLSFTNALTAHNKAYMLPYFYNWSGTTWLPYHFDGAYGGTNQIPASCIQFTDSTSHQTNYLFIAHIVDVNTDDNLLCWDNGMIIQKDLACGGIIAAEQGVLALGHGFINSDEMPYIWLQHDWM
jgi:hypothetical protein